MIADADIMGVGALDASDGRKFDVRVAGSAALLVAKVHKVRDRSGTERSTDKDALDVLRLLRGTTTNVLPAACSDFRETTTRGRSRRRLSICSGRSLRIAPERGSRWLSGRSVRSAIRLKSPPPARYWLVICSEPWAVESIGDGEHPHQRLAAAGGHGVPHVHLRRGGRRQRDGAGHCRRRRTPHPYAAYWSGEATKGRRTGLDNGDAGAVSDRVRGRLQGRLPPS